MLLLALIWVASLLVVNPLGDFPLNDDWSFGLAVKRLLQTGEFRPTGWTSMPLITQTLWGSLFCLPAGFSFNALRLSTLLLSLCGLLVVYLLVRQVHPSRFLAAFVALTVGFNPIYYALSNTFMTDVPFIAFLLGAAWFFSRNLQGGSDIDLLCGLACALAATLCRQLGLAAPLGFLVCLLWSRGTSARWVIRALLPFGLCLGALLAFQHWLQANGRLPALYTLKDQALSSVVSRPRQFVPGLAKHIGTALLYLGWFSLPVIVLVLPAAARAAGLCSAQSWFSPWPEGQCRRRATSYWRRASAPCLCGTCISSTCHICPLWGKASGWRLLPHLCWAGLCWLALRLEWP